MTSVTNDCFRILIADDNWVCLKGVTGILRRSFQNVVCESATRGEEALRKAAETFYDIIVMDYYLGDDNGAEVAKSILKHQTTRIIGYTSNSEEEKIRKECLAAGMEDVLDKKPILVRDYLKQKTRLKPIVVAKA
jgi:CheY-like chemotaxis protein